MNQPQYEEILNEVGLSPGFRERLREFLLGRGIFESIQGPYLRDYCERAKKSAEHPTPEDLALQCQDSERYLAELLARFVH